MAFRLTHMTRQGMRSRRLVPLLRQRRRGKSGLHRAGCRITSGRGNPRESATEKNRLPKREVRVKRQCKRLPPRWQQGGHMQAPSEARLKWSHTAARRAPGKPLDPSGNGRARQMTAHDRTRLIALPQKENCTESIPFSAAFFTVSVFRPTSLRSICSDRVPSPDPQE